MRTQTATLPLRALLACALAPIASACSGGDLGPALEESSFSRIQSEIFSSSCVGCHTAGSQDAVRSGLILDAAVAYQNLVGAEASNANARTDGMRRVVPFQPNSSLLYHKLFWAGGHHGRDYGSPMPLGGTPLSLGKIEYIRRWIVAGAPRTGDTIEVSLLSDRTPQDLTPFTPPAAPARGYQLKIDRFSVAPNFEREIFVHRRVGNTTDVFVNRMETSMRPGSHHFVIYGFPSTTPTFAVPALDLVRDIRRPDGTLDLLAMVPMAYHSFVGGAMTTQADWRFPAGVALRLPANATLDLNSHYANRTSAEVSGEVYANIHTLDQSEVRYEAHSLNLSNNSITLPPRTRTTLTRSFTMPERVSVFLLTSHMHEHGERFVIRIVGGARNGEIVYETASWSHPEIKTFEPALVLATGESLRSEVTYNNTTDQTIRFGLTSQDEMGIIFGYFYCQTTCTTALSAMNQGPQHPSP